MGAGVQTPNDNNEPVNIKQRSNSSVLCFV